MADAADPMERLRGEQMRLENELKQLVNEEKQADEQREGRSFGKREEGATETFELEKRIALDKRLSGALAEVKRAIEKYESGTYGMCDTCKNPIEPARLEALPHASLCLKCKSHQMKNARGA
jgi:DnaK suppressor protein